MFGVLTDYEAYPRINRLVMKVRALHRDLRSASIVADRRTPIERHVRFVDTYAPPPLLQLERRYASNSTAFAWLSASDHRSFAFRDPHGSFTARREQRRGRWYWYAYRVRSGVLRKKYLGAHDELALFFGIFAAEGLLFGFGVAFMIFGGRTVRHLARAVGAPAWPVFVSIAWTLLSWWPHDGFHRASGVGDLDATLRVDYAFHLTLIVAAVCIAHCFLATLRATSPGQVARVSR